MPDTSSNFAILDKIGTLEYVESRDKMAFIKIYNWTITIQEILLDWHTQLGVLEEEEAIIAQIRR